MTYLYAAFAAMAILCLSQEFARADVWYSCEQITEFCAGRPLHRDCTPKTQFGLPLSIMAQCDVPPSPYEECRKHPYNMNCPTATKEWCSKACE